MLPSKDAATTVYRPCWSAAMLRIISTTTMQHRDAPLACSKHKPSIEDTTH
jgi:hypothetical protein